MKTRTMKFVGAACVLSFITVPAWGQSSKFAATYDTDIRMIDIGINGDDNSCQEIGDVTICEAIAGPVAEAELASLHVAQWKEAFLAQSGQVNLVTFTQAKGKNNGGTSTAIAEGTVRAGVLVLPEGARQGNPTAATCSRAFAAYDGGNNVFAPPGPVTFASRRQELAVTVALDVINDPNMCVDGGAGLPAECVADYLDIDGSVTVALGLDTTAAHHFEYIAEDLTSGRYDIIGCYDLTALVEVSGGDIDAGTVANSKVALGPRMISAQEVRATKTGIIDETGSD